ncbi:MAG: dephospho-CoA kinase [Coriobacteriales bacterium]|nr:dephospho-CoA kinase [Coriobacteriales bacterium]
MFITGGLASGKNTVGEYLESKGATVRDLDVMAKDEQENPIIKEQIINQFGADLLDVNGDINRSLLAERAFSDADSAAKLGAICWPPVQERLADILIGGSCQPLEHAELTVVEIPLLVESGGFKDLADEIMTVEADEDIRLSRAIERGMSREDAENRIELQATSEERCEVADTVIYNNSTLASLYEQIDGWYNERMGTRLF